jgi:hypothetical protein
LANAGERRCTSNSGCGASVLLHTSAATNNSRDCTVLHCKHEQHTENRLMLGLEFRFDQPLESMARDEVAVPAQPCNRQVEQARVPRGQACGIEQ